MDDWLPIGLHRRPQIITKRRMLLLKENQLILCNMCAQMCPRFSPANQLQHRADSSIDQESPFSRVIWYVSISNSATVESRPLLSYPCLFTTPPEALSSHILSISPKKSRQGLLERRPMTLAGPYVKPQKQVLYLESTTCRARDGPTISPETLD